MGRKHHIACLIRIWCQQRESSPAWWGWGGGVMVWGMISWNSLALLIAINHGLNATVGLSLLVDHTEPFIATALHLSNGYIHLDNPACHKAKVANINVLRWSSQSPDQKVQIRDPINSTWIRISKACFQHLPCFGCFEIKSTGVSLSHQNQTFTKFPLLQRQVLLLESDFSTCVEVFMNPAHKDAQEPPCDSQLYCN